MNSVKLDLRKDIAELCVIDCTNPPGRDEALPWRNGDRFTNAKGRTYRWEYSIRGWRMVS